MNSAIRQPELRQRLGGRWALSWQAYVITVPLAIASLVLWARSPSEALRWILIGVISTGVAGGWAYLMHRTVFRDRARTPVPIGWVVGSSVVAASIFVGVSLALGFVLGVNELGRLVPNPIPTLIFATGWGLGIAMILESQWRFKVQRDELLTHAIQQQLATLQEHEVLDQIRRRIDTEVGEELTTARRRIETHLDHLMSNSADSVVSIAQDLRRTADSTVRPLSHQLMRQAQHRHPTPNLFTVLANIVRYQPFRPLAVSIIYLVTATATELSRHGAWTGIGLLAVTVVLIFATMSMVNFAMRRWSSHHAALFLGGLAFVQIPTVVLAPLRSEITGTPVGVLDLAVSFIVGSIVILATSAFGAWNRSREEVIAEFAEEIRHEQIITLARATAVAEAAHEAATLMHGRMQSRLLACAASLDLAYRSGDVIGINRALMQAHAILDEPLLPLKQSRSEHLASLVQDKAAQWDGLVEIEVDIESDIGESTGPLAKHISAIIEESIANAIHHGRASHIAVSIRVDDNTIHVGVVDDGVGPGRGSPGLGSQLMGDFAASWSLSAAAPHGSILDVRIPSFA